MQGFDLEQLRTLVAAVEAGSLTAAAPLRFLSQSALSEQLRKLEAQAGRPLLVRSKAGVSPTEAGLRLLAHARRILAESEAAWRDLHEVPLSGELRLAITDYFRPRDIATLLARLSMRFPALRLHVHIDKSDAIEHAYRAGAYDLALTMRVAVAGTGSAGATVLAREPLAWVSAPGLVLRPREPRRLVLLPESCALRRWVVRTLDARRVPYVVAHVASGVAGVQSAVAAGLGLGCLNRSALGEGLLALTPSRVLPALPQVEFRMLPARGVESTSVRAARELIGAEWAAAGAESVRS